MQGLRKVIFELANYSQNPTSQLCWQMIQGKVRAQNWNYLPDSASGISQVASS